MLNLITRTLLGVAALTLALVGRAQDYPAKQIRIVVPYVGGGGMSDRTARMLSEKLRDKWGQPLIVEARPGANTNIGAEFVAKAAPDGYTLLFIEGTPLVTNKSLYPKLAYDPEAFVPVSVVLKAPLILVVHPKVPANSFQELLAYAKANPDRLNLASNGSGSGMHLLLELLKMETGVRIAHVPYKGVPPAVTDLIGERVDMMFVSLGTVLQHVRSGRLRVLAVASEKRMRELPEVPAIAELVPGFVAESWFGVVAPPKTPAAIASKLSAGIAEALRLPELVKQFENLSVEGVGSTPAEMARLLKEETTRWGRVIRVTGVKAE